VHHNISEVPFEQELVAQSPGSCDEEGEHNAPVHCLGEMGTLLEDGDGRWEKQEPPGRDRGVCAVQGVALRIAVAIAQQVYVRCVPSASSLPRHERLPQPGPVGLLPRLVDIGASGLPP
jgi:hypothetical protein